jgi:RNA recognition motif-containing protein
METSFSANPRRLGLLLLALPRATLLPPADGASPVPAAPKERKERKPRAPKTPKPARAPGEAPAGEPSKTMLFVANLGFTVDDAALSTLFTEAGITVISARVVRRRWGQPRRSKGYGFVDVGSEEQQQKAIEALQSKEVGGREIVLKIAVDSDVKKADEEAKAATNDGPVAVATPV